MSLLLLFRGASGLKFSPDALSLPVLGSNKAGLTLSGLRTTSPIPPAGRGNALRNGFAPAVIQTRTGPQGIPVAGPFAPVTYAGQPAPITQRAAVPLLLGAYLGRRAACVPPIVQAPDVQGALSPSGGAALSASLDSQSATTAALTTAIQLLAALEGQATTTAALTTAIQLLAALEGQAATTAALTTAIQLLAALEGQAATTAALRTATQLLAVADGQASATATLYTAIKLLAIVEGQATATAALTAHPGAAHLQASADSQAAVTAALTTAIKLLAAIEGQADATAALTTAIKLFAAIEGQATAMADFRPPPVHAAPQAVTVACRAGDVMAVSAAAQPAVQVTVGSANVIAVVATATKPWES